MNLNNILKARLYLPENTSCALLRKIIDMVQGVSDVGSEVFKKLCIQIHLLVFCILEPCGRLKRY